MTEIQKTRAAMLTLFAEVEAIEMRLNNARNADSRDIALIETLRNQYAELGEQFNEAWDAWNLANQQARLRHVFNP